MKDRSRKAKLRALVRNKKKQAANFDPSQPRDDDGQWSADSTSRADAYRAALEKHASDHAAWAATTAKMESDHAAATSAWEARDAKRDARREKIAGAVEKLQTQGHKRIDREAAADEQPDEPNYPDEPEEPEEPDYSDAPTTHARQRRPIHRAHQRTTPKLSDALVRLSDSLARAEAELMQR